MSKKKGGSDGHLAITLATAGGAFLLRKILATAWTKTLHKEPPTDLTEPGVSYAEAIGWAVLTAVIVESARFGVTRSARRRSERAELEAAGAEQA